MLTGHHIISLNPNKVAILDCLQKSVAISSLLQQTINIQVLYGPGVPAQRLIKTVFSTEV